MQNRVQYMPFFLQRELNQLYLSLAIRAFANGLIAIFIPIYLIELGYDVATVLLFYAILHLTIICFAIPAAKIAAKYGFKHVMFYSIPLYVLVLALLYSLDMYHWPLASIGIIAGVSQAFFWMGYHIDFAKFSDHKKRVRQVGMSRIVAATVQAVSPLLGGILISIWGFKSTFILAAGLLFTSIIPFIATKDGHVPLKISLKKLYKEQRPRDILAFMGRGIEDAVSFIFWPIIIYFSILGSYTSLGSVRSLSLIIIVVVMCALTKYADRVKKILLKIGAYVNALVWVAKAFVKTTGQVFLLEGLYGISQTLIDVPFDAISYDKANKKNIIRYTVIREIALHSGMALIFIIGAFTTSLVSGLGFAAVSSLLLLFF